MGKLYLYFLWYYIVMQLLTLLSYIYNVSQMLLTL